MCSKYSKYDIIKCIRIFLPATNEGLQMVAVKSMIDFLIDSSVSPVQPTDEPGYDPTVPSLCPCLCPCP